MILATLQDWRDVGMPDSTRQTVLITVMKQHRHLRQLNALLQRLPLAQTPALVIDDEADQAGLNNLVNQGRESTTYACLVALRRLLPHHTYLQYTATPQAPLLINVIDALSPRFAQVLTPGPDYVGGGDLFVRRPNLVQTIPVADIITAANPLTEPAGSLLEALRIFFLGVAAGWIVDEAAGNRSMMIHPSQQTVLHNDYCNWVTAAKDLWLRLLELPVADPDRHALIADLETSYADLRTTVDDLPRFEDLLTMLPRAIRKTRIWLVNAATGATPRIDWKADGYGHILVGGQAMDRGFTVSGLTVTYMPRGVGTGMADTVQQRARFFGYKRQYLGYCRVYLEADARSAYRAYVEHEESVRQALIDHRRTGLPLSEWKRAFFLDMRLQPTRRSVMDLSYLQDVLSDEWYTPKAPHDSDEAVAANRAVVQGFLQRLTMQPDAGSGQRTEMQKHEVADGVPLSLVLTELLTTLRISRSSDSQRFTGLLLQVSAYSEEHPDARCQVFHMSRGAERERAADSDDQIPTLFQGASPSHPSPCAVRCIRATAPSEGRAA